MSGEYTLALQDLNKKMDKSMTMLKNIDFSFHKLKDMPQRVEELKAQLISGFHHDEYPVYQQGEPNHEVLELTTAEEVNGLVNRIKLLTKALDWATNYWLTNGNIENKYVPKELAHIFIESRERVFKGVENDQRHENKKAD
jgi:hypothetical protein